MLALLSLTLAVCTPLVAPPASAQECPPPGAVCPRGGSAIHVDFESLPAGTSVEGLGAVHPDLAIATVAGAATPACTVGSAHIIEELDMTYPAYGSTAGTNDCLTGIRGFGDNTGCTLDYEFTFSPMTTVSCLSLRILDYGDLFPNGGMTHTVTLQGFAGMTLVDTAQLVMMSGVQLVSGDACSAQPGDPGNTLLRVVGTGITKVTLTFDAFNDPNVGFDDLQFCKDAIPVGATPVVWGSVKSLYAAP